MKETSIYEKNDSISPLVSVIVPIYNVELYLERCINSIINQTYQNLEIILVDDGSTDNSLEICDKFQQKDSRIRVIHKENGGVVSARKAGIQSARGTYVAYLDSDDWIETDMYEELVCQIVQNNADIVTSGLYRDYLNSTIKEFDNLPEGVYDLKRIERQILPVLMYTGIFYKAGVNIHFCNKLFKREIALNNQQKIDNNIRIGEDAAFIYPCVMDAEKIVIIHKCFYHYCIRQDSMMGTGYQKELLGYKHVYQIIKDKIDQYGKHSVTLMMQLDYLMLYQLLLKEPQTVIKNVKGNLFPFEDVKITDRIVLYGGGKFGNTLHRFLKERDLCEIVLWVDKSEDIQRGIVDCSKLNNISKKSYDKIIIAMLVGVATNEAYQNLINMGIDKKKIAKVNLSYEMIIRGKEWKLLFGE